MKFQELTDRQWDFIIPSIPPPAYTGRPRADDRMTVNGILYVLMSGCRWRTCRPNTDATRPCGSGTRNGVSEKGIWKNIMDSLVSHGYHKGLVNVNYLSIDSSTVPAKKGGKR